jgi:hypothetical protein
MSHFTFTLLAALVLAAALAMAGDRTPRERLYAAVRVYFGCVLAVVAGSWIMRLIHG